MNVFRRPAVTAAYVVAIGVTVAVLAMTWLAGVFTDKEVEFGTDYSTFYGAALLVTEGQGSDIYDGNALADRINEATGSDLETDAFGHFPFFALFFVPLTVVPFAVGYFGFTAAGVLALGLMLSRVGVKRVALVLGLVAVSMAGFWTLHLGQMGFLVSALLLAVFLAVQSGRRFTAGLWIGLLVFKPTYAVGVGIWWILRAAYFRSSIAGAALSACVVALTGFAIPGGWESYRSFVSSAGLAGGDVTTSGFSVLEMWQSMLSNQTFEMVLWALSATAIVALFGVVIRRLDHRLEPSMALAVVVGLLVSPRTGWYDWMLLVIPAVLFWQTYPRLRPQLVVAGAWLFLAGAVSRLVAGGLDDATGFFLQLAPIVLAGVAVWWVRLLLVQERSPQRELSGSAGTLTP